MMKALRALMLVLALSVCAYAGNMGNGAIEPPPPTTAPAVAPGTGGDKVIPELDTGVASTDPVTEIALNLLQSVLSLI